MSLQVRAESMEKVRGQSYGTGAVTEAFPGAQLVDNGGWAEPNKAPVPDSEIPF